MFATPIHSHICLIFAGKTGAYHSGAPCRTPLWLEAPSLEQMLGYGGSAWQRQTLDYYDTTTYTTLKVL